MKLTEKIIWNDLEDDQFMVVEEIDLKGLKYGQLMFKGIMFQVDLDLNTVDNLGLREVVVDFTTNIIFDPKEK